MSDPQNTRGTPGDNEEADTASGGAPERADAHKAAHTTSQATDGNGVHESAAYERDEEE